MIARTLSRRFAPLLVGAVALGLTGCTNTTTDAATVSYKDSTGSHTTHISRSEFEGELHNAVLVVRTFLDIDTDRAFAVVVDLITSRMRQFEHVLAEELPALVEDFGLDEKGRAALDAYVTELKDWMAGIVHWHEACSRYRDTALRYPAPRFGGASGLGTSAVHLARLLPAG